MGSGFQRYLAAISQLNQAPLARYGFAAASAAGVLLLTGLLRDALDGLRYSPALIAIMVSSLYGGFGPGLVTTLITSIGIPGLFPVEAVAAEATDSSARFHQLPLFETAALIVSLVGSIARGAGIHRGATLQSDVSLGVKRPRKSEGELVGAMEHPLHVLVDGVRDIAIFLLDPDGRIMTWNPGAEQLNSYTATEAVGRHISMFYRPEDIARGTPDQGLAAASREGRYEKEGFRIRKDGSTYWAHVVITALRDESGRLWGFSNVIRDTTAQRRSEEERTRLVHKLKEALRARDEFLSVASHELKTPLTTLQLQVQSLQRSMNREPAGHTAMERLAAKLAMIERQVGRMTELINNLLDVSGIMAGRFRMKIEDVDLSSVTRDIAARLREPLRDAGCELILNAQAPVMGRWSRLRLEGVVTNLLLNAIKFGPGKPIEMTVSEGRGRARLEVRDHGIGIAEGDQRRIFERYERAVSEQYSGIGVGLWVVRQTVEAFGGTVKVHSVVGAGSTFIVELPREPRDESSTSRSPPSASDRAA